LETTEDIGGLPEVPSSVINYGIPDLTGKTVNGVLSSKLEDSIKRSIRWFEPRLISDTIQVVVNRSSGEHARPNAIAIEIRADLWCQPIPERLYVSTVVDLEAGIIDVVDQSKQFELTPPPSHEVTAAPIPEPVAPIAPAATITANTMVIDTPVRAGQRVYARGADLVIMAVVNPGAEVIADGSIHVYAPLRGRALAGASGNSDARIFSLSMEAELVSIAGVYRTFDEGWSTTLAGKPAQIRLNNDSLDITAISLK
jgi:septum site-determining protein MinC